MQICKKCGIEKPFIEYYVRKDTGKYRAVCKLCQIATQRNKPKKKQNRKSREGASQKWHEYISRNPTITRSCSGCQTEYTLDMYHSDAVMRCKNCIRAQRKSYRDNNATKLKEESLSWRETNRDYLNSKAKLYRQSNKETIRKRNRAYMARRRSTDPQYRLCASMGGQLNKALKMRDISKCRASWQKLVGYTAQELKIHLEKLFTPEMTWENYGSYWHVDHVKPQSWFEYTSVSDQAFLECWALENLQPLEAFANMRKQNKWVG